ncbi:hypothetical protein VOLCADRAFT_104409 [Volvox carteri f. nagariensis]|uniref:Serine/threonine-protein phosphatase 4 regulatory subunit 3-like central domain-containing protein n=1 Tax=Volvox carteri f. nagariensis TaxID=3068 RepID=D8TTG5_VOLCA|nr:uncharacterized protein VOLCADRAFT_104409 [Volvox carteri f. nagariensis]EFJ49195.1 hypothetical protein VOLCADRAFT_104409 [Volvox carteri f. nagariensis]|eukprot:XP_002949643.1 hypothetical protein VOLCADRAFT_104409 [Volvox carteri f. nagariensis]
MHTNFSMHRVKVYKLNVEGQWEDKGTGHISVEYMEQAHAMGLVVISEEENGKTLLVHQISREDIYSRSGGNKSSRFSKRSIEDIKVGNGTIRFKRFLGPKIEHFADHERGRDFLENELELPAPERRNLEDVAKRDRVAAQLMKQNYLPALLDQFKQCEDLEDSEGLSHMYTIVRSAIMLNDSSVLEEMLREEHVMDVLGALEYDPDVKQPQKHRDFLQSHVQFKEVVPITNPQILAKIHQTYRIQYLKDVILPRSLDDATYATLSSLALFNNMEVVGALMADASFLPQLFQRLQQTDPSDAQWHDLVAFLQVVTRIMLHSAEDVKLKATDILMSSMQHDVLALREFLYKQPEHTLFGLLVHELSDGRDTGLAEQVCEAIKLLMDPDNMEQPVEKNEFLEVFYDKYLDKLIGVILSDSSINSTGTRAVPATTLGLILELLSFCVQNHSYRIRYYTLRNHLVEKVLRLLHRRERWLVCATVRFMRVCVALKEDFFTRYLLRYNCFGPIMVVFFENGERYNLLNSAVLDLIDYIRKENIKPILDHLVETYGHRFDELTYVETFKQLRLKYDQAPERAGSTGNGTNGRGDEEMTDASGSAGPHAGSAAANLRGRTYVFSSTGMSHQTRVAAQHAHGRRRRRDDREPDKDEEDYFSEDADDEQEEMHRSHAHKQQHHPEQQTIRDSVKGSSSMHATDLGTRNGPRGNGRDGEGYSGAGGTDGCGVTGARGGMAGVASGGGGTQTEPALAATAPLASSHAARSSTDRSGGLQADGQQQGLLGSAQHESSRQWPGLVDYDDDDDAAVGEEGNHTTMAEPSLRQQQQLLEHRQGPGNGPVGSSGTGRSPSLDLGRRARSEMEDSKVDGMEEGSAAGGVQDQRKRLRNEDAGSQGGSAQW